jgi:hypothetical protein
MALGQGVRSARAAFVNGVNAGDGEVRFTYQVGAGCGTGGAAGMPATPARAVTGTARFTG